MSLEVDDEQNHWSVWYSKISMGRDALPLMHHFQGKYSVLSQRTEDEKNIQSTRTSEKRVMDDCCASKYNEVDDFGRSPSNPVTLNRYEIVSVMP